MYSRYNRGSQEDGRPPSDSSGGGKSELHTGRVLDNVQARRRDGKCNRDRPPLVAGANLWPFRGSGVRTGVYTRGKGETVRSERTSEPGDRPAGQTPPGARPNRRALGPGPPSGWSHEASSNRGPRWMAAIPSLAEGYRTRLTVLLARGAFLFGATPLLIATSRQPGAGAVRRYVTRNRDDLNRPVAACQALPGSAVLRVVEEDVHPGVGQ